MIPVRRLASCAVNLCQPKYASIGRHQANTARGFSNWGSNRGPSLSLNNAMWAIIGTNVAVFGLYQVTDRRLVHEHSVLSLESLMNLRWHTALTNSLFHGDDIFHLGTNMLTIYLVRNLFSQLAFSSSAFRMRGSLGMQFIRMYAVSAVAGSVAHVAFALAQTYHRNPRFYQSRSLSDRYVMSSVPSTFGSGAAIAGTLAGVISRVGISSTVYVNFIPVPLGVFFAIFVGQDVYRALGRGDEAKLGDHIGATLAGLLLARAI